MQVTGTVYTIGHSTHQWDAFVTILDRCQIGLLADIRSHPGSTKWPWFNKAAMQRRLGDRYCWLPDLGGPTHGPYSGRAFPKHHIAQQIAAPDDGRPHWTNRGLHDFGQFMATPRFRSGLEQLLQLVDADSGRRVAIMCAELQWWRCHRASVADSWVGCGGTALHLWPNGKQTDHAEVLGNRLERYEDSTRQLWNTRQEGI